MIKCNLLDLPMRQGVKIELETVDKGKEIYIFSHIDGMYSYSYSENDKSRVIHLSAMTPLKKYTGKDYYVIDMPEPDT